MCAFGGVGRVSIINLVLTESRRSRSNYVPVTQVLLFALVAVLIVGLLASLGGFSPADRDLMDSDGYMRYLRIEALASGGPWHNPVVERSNYPYGETSHWTRPLDVYVLALSALLRPVAGSLALYWASVINAPLLLVALGPLAYWALGHLLRGDIRTVLMPSLLVQPLIVAYFGFGRVDHHAPILICFAWTVGLVLRAVQQPTRRRAILLGTALALGLWVSTEFIVLWIAVAATLAVLEVVRPRTDTVSGFAVFAVTTAATAIAVWLERGWSTAVEYDRISVVHVALAAVAALVFLAVSRVPGGSGSVRRPLVAMVAAGLAGVALLMLLFPDLLGGPFAGVDHLVREKWLNHVVELHPVRWSDGVGLILFRVVPLVLGIAAWFAVRDRCANPNQRGLRVVFSWLLGYSVLALLQFRWVLFAQFLAVPLVLAAIAPWYVRLGAGRAGTVVRPLVLSMILALPIVGAGLTSTRGGTGSGGATNSAACNLDHVLGPLESRPVETVLADIDVGPELMYRTNHNVVATPYHRNTAGIRDLIEIMSAADTGTAQQQLGTRPVDLVLICPGSSDLTQPSSQTGTFYDALVNGPRPGFVRPVSLPGETDYLLFEVVS